MFLTYGDLARLFPKGKGIQVEELFFHTVATISEIPQHKGVFIPCEENSGELLTAISNGAIAALWDEKVVVPKYTPNHFPLFFTNDLLKGLMDMMEIYLENINQTENLQTEGTDFHFSKEMKFKENISAYNHAEIVGKINNISKLLQHRMEGAK